MAYGVDSHPEPPDIEYPDSPDDVDLDHVHKGYVFRNTEGKLYLVCCPSCGRENWTVEIATGSCAWCGYDAQEEDVDG